MKNSTVKRPFVVRTIIAMVIIFVTVSAVATYACAQKYVSDVEQDINNKLKFIAVDINECKDVNKDSIEYRNGINVAQAYAVMRYYRFSGMKDIKDEDVSIDIGLYYVEKDSSGNETGFREVIPQTTTLYGAPFSTRSSIVVLNDVLTKEQVNEVEKVINSGNLLTYIENAKGYKDGRFFYPEEMPVGMYKGKSVRIDTIQEGTAAGRANVDFQDIQVVMSNGEIIGGHVNEKLKSTEFRRMCEEENRIMIKDGASVYHNSNAINYNFFLTEADFEDSEVIRGTDYVIKAYAQASPIKYAVSVLNEFYLCVLLLMLLVSIVLISSHNNTIERKLETEKKRRYMMNSMAHEMKTPLSVIRGFGELLLEENDREKRNRFTNSIINEADSMNNIIISMLDFAKMEAGTYPMELSSLSVVRIVEKQLEHARVLMDRKRLLTETDIQSTDMILADEKLVNNIVSNFISNAVSHAAVGGKIRVEIKGDNDEIYIGVYNQGAQIAPEEIEKLWESFYRNRAVNEESSGLGLAIVRNACLMHNGSYGCFNEEDGVTFWARIKSMEDDIEMKEAMTGPVIGVTGPAYHLNHILTIAAGLMIEWLSFENVWTALLGIILITFGAYNFFKNEFYNKNTLIASVVLAVCTVGIQWLKVSERASEHPELLLAGNIILICLLFVITLQTLNIFIDISGSLRETSKLSKLKHRRLLFIIVCAALMIFIVLYTFASASDFWWKWYYVLIRGGIVFIAVYITATLVLCYKWFNKKTKVNA